MHFLTKQLVASYNRFIVIKSVDSLKIGSASFINDPKYVPMMDLRVKASAGVEAFEYPRPRFSMKKVSHAKQSFSSGGLGWTKYWEMHAYFERCLVKCWVSSPIKTHEIHVVTCFPKSSRLSSMNVLYESSEMSLVMNKHLALKLMSSIKAYFEIKFSTASVDSLKMKKCKVYILISWLHA